LKDLAYDLKFLTKNMLTETLQFYCSKLQQQGLYRQRKLNDMSPNAINFSSNDYLSLASDPYIKKAYQQGFQQYPAGSGGSMVISGYHSTHKALEQAFVNSLKVDDCLLFSSGYAANLSVLRLLAQFDTHVLIDKMVHASIYDGLQAANAVYSRYMHNDLNHLSQKLKGVPSNSIVITEGMFSMSGACPPLNAIRRLSEQATQGLIVDEAHSFGVLGDKGLGAVIEHQLTQQDVPLRIIPFGKAFAASGAIVAGQQAWIDALLQVSRAYVYSTAMSPAVAYGLLVTLEQIKAAEERRTKLKQLINHFREAIKQSPLQWRDSRSPIQQLQLGCPHQASQWSAKLNEQGIICMPIRQPTVSKQETGLRIILNYDHRPEDIDYLLKILHYLVVNSDGCEPSK
jgi:8-amino-7-oxononanoate synthase